MTPELTVLALAALLQGLQFSAVSLIANLEIGPGKTLSPRDPQRLGKPLMDHGSVGAGRLFRAMNNHFEALILFTIAVVVISLGDKGTGFSAICAWTYLGARILYVPAYYFGWVPWRSLIWFVGFLSTMLMIISALF
jgi:uncharacterized MAPEG superfamily protein